jgi:uroporphyrinogen III methyltransferase/synthase
MPIVVPAIEIHPPPDPALLARALVSLSSDYDLVAFTSVNAVERFFAALTAEGRGAWAFGGSTIAAVGSSTAEALARRGLPPNIVAMDARGEGLAHAIVAEAAALRQKRVLLPRALVARETLPELLRAAGFTVDVVPVYETRPPSPEALAALRAELAAGRIDAVTFTSSSTVDNLADALGPDAALSLRGAKTFSIGPVTTATATQRGIEVAATAASPTISGLISALEGYFGGETEH